MNIASMADTTVITCFIPPQHGYRCPYHSTTIYDDDADHSLPLMSLARFAALPSLPMCLCPYTHWPNVVTNKEMLTANTRTRQRPYVQVNVDVNEDE
jgi:hypothetical protein